MEAQQSKLEFFCKLGYSKEQVSKVLEKLGLEASENDLLQELIRMGSSITQEPENWMKQTHFKPGAQAADKVLPLSRQSIDTDLRPIVIDGSNVALSHGNNEVFSCMGIQLVVDWFKNRGHRDIKVFVPSWRKAPARFDNPITDQHVLEKLTKQAVLVYTPSRKMKGKRMVCYDDRYIVKLAYEQDGVIVSNDNFRDLQNENPEWKWFIEQRLLMYSFVNDLFMPPDDPLGRHGPSLASFLSKKSLMTEPKWQLCPYSKKCTYGNKCKFYHPERVNCDRISVADELRAKTKSYSLTQISEEEKRKTNPTKNGGGNTYSSVGPKESNAIGRNGSSAHSFEELHNKLPQWKGGISNSANDCLSIHHGGWQPKASALHEDQDKHTGAILKQLYALSLYSGYTRPGKYEDIVDDQNKVHNLKHNTSLPHCSQCLECPCLQRCSFQGLGVCQDEKVLGLRPLSQVCRMQTPTAQLPEISGFVRPGLKDQSEEHSLIASSSNLFSYNHGDMQNPGNLQAKSCTQSHWLDLSLFGASELYAYSSDTESEQNVFVNSHSREQTPCSSCPHKPCPAHTLMY